MTLKIISTIATLNIHTSFNHLKLFFGFPTDIYLPQESESMYNLDDHEFKYNDNPDLIDTIIFANYTDLTRLESSALADSLEIEPVGYIIGPQIVKASYLEVPFNDKKFKFFVSEVTVLDLERVKDLGTAIHKLTLVPHV